MTTDVIMPQMGESVTEGTITVWYKKVGDWVEKDEPLLLITTDKVDADVPSPASGYLNNIAFPEGDTVDIDTVIARLGSEENGSSTATPTGSTAIIAEEREGESTTAPPSIPVPSGQSSAFEAGAGVEQLRRTRSSPLVRKMAAAEGVDIAELTGTGVSGRVTKSDLQDYLKQGPPRKAAPTQERAPSPVRENRYAYQPIASDRLEPFTPMRAQIADHMVISRETSVHVTTVFEVDMTRVSKLRAKHKSAYEAKGAKLSFMPFILSAVTKAIRAYPVLNSALVDRSIAYRQDVNIGMAVAVDWGLLVPVIRHADEKSLIGLSRSVQDLAERARDRKLTADDLQGGTFTVTNPGVFGSLFGTPIINQPQVAILCVGTITKRPVVTDDDAIAIRHMMYLSLSFDHRVIDGATGDRFMKTVKDGLENFSEGLI